MEKEILLFGGLLLDHYFSVDRWPQRGQDGYVVGQARFVGGCAANMAVTIHNLGGHPHVVSCVGSDRSGETIQRYWREHGLSQRFILETEGETGSCLVFSEPNGERTFLTRKGVELSFPADLAEAVLLCEPAWAGVTGYYLLGEEGPQILSCLERLHRRGTRILFDPSPLAGDIAPALRKRILAISDVLTPSEKELDALGGHEGGERLGQAGKTVVWKQGARGGVVQAPRERFSYEAEPCLSVDTTGAGDSFSGALLYALAQGGTLREGIALAARCAAKTVELRGPHGFWKKRDGFSL